MLFSLLKPAFFIARHKSFWLDSDCNNVAVTIFISEESSIVLRRKFRRAIHSPPGAGITWAATTKLQRFSSSSLLQCCFLIEKKSFSPASSSQSQWRTLFFSASSSTLSFFFSFCLRLASDLESINNCVMSVLMLLFQLLLLFFSSYFSFLLSKGITRMRKLEVKDIESLKLFVKVTAERTMRKQAGGCMFTC